MQAVRLAFSTYLSAKTFFSKTVNFTIDNHFNKCYNICIKINYYIVCGTAAHA